MQVRSHDSDAFSSKRGRYQRQKKLDTDTVSILVELEQAYQESLGGLSKAEVSRIQLLVSLSQQKVYGLETLAIDTYFAGVLNRNLVVETETALSVATERSSKVEQDILQGKLILMTKDNDIQRQTEQIASKINRTNVQMTSMLADSQSMQSHNRGYSTDLTHIRSFLKNIQQKQKKVRQRVEKSYDMEQESRQRHLFEEEETQKLRHRQKIQIQRAKQQLKRRSLEAERQDLIHKEESFKEYIGKLNRGDKPLFEQKSEQFLERQSKEKEELRLKIQQIKSRWKPIDGDEIKQHGREYQQHRADLVKRRLEKSMQTRHSPILDNLYKGKFYKLISLDDKYPNDERDKARSLRQKIDDFSQQVRQNYKPKIDQAKRLQLKNLIQLQEKKQRLRYSSSPKQRETSINPRSIGNQYLKQLKRMTPDINNSFSKPLSQPKTKPISARSRKSNQIKQYLYQGTKGLKSTLSTWKKIISSNQLSREQKYSSILSKASLLDSQARRKQQQLQVSHKGTARAMQLKDSIDKYYLSSIHAKLELMNRALKH